MAEARIRHLILFGFPALSLFVVTGCTELADDVAAHPKGWTDPTSDNFHSFKVSVAGFTSCSQCHGENLDGGTSKVACNNDNCHSGGGIIPHPESWGAPGDPFHGDQVRLKGFEPCALCHGADFKGGFTGKGCSSEYCHTNASAIPHPGGWTAPDSVNFHDNWIPVVGLDNCTGCHGDDFSGGASGVACSGTICHTGGDAIPHPDGWTTDEDPDFHGDWIRQSGLSSCTVCHGDELDGGIVDLACSSGSCHTGGRAIPHPAGWTTSSHADFHGDWIGSNGFDYCTACHGEDFSGGYAELACSNSSCHTGGAAIPHPDEWITEGNANFHGEWVSTAGLSSCKVCHGDDFGGGHAELACNNSSCHTGGAAIPHLDGWITEGNVNFHGDWVLAEGFSDCFTCHGEDLRGGFTEVACSNSTCHTGGDAIPHPEDWATPGSDLFHGDWVPQSGLDYCADCHGEDFSGGIVELACSNGSCHLGAQAIPHPILSEFTDPTHENYHGSVFWANNWDFSYCQACHGTNLAGGVADYSCRKGDCHAQPEGIFACDNCHGSSASEPFVDVRNQTSTDLVTVGLHTSHLHPTRNISSSLDCDDCHVVPDSMWATGHIDGSAGQAEVTFGTLATAGGTLSPIWDHSAATCSDMYCHGNFAYGSVVGNDRLWTWTEAVTGDLCGTCHGLPPTGHITGEGIERCGEYCHSNVVSHVDHRTIKDKTLHINGENDFIQD
jgi:predicted CxxxxCH...CXXCH cytochrome family protein